MKNLRLLGPGMVFGGFGPNGVAMRRPLALLLAALAASAAPVLAAGRGPVPVTVLVATTVSENARRTMPPELWQKLVDEYVFATKIIHFAGTGSPTLADCKAAKAVYAVTASFDLAPRLPGFAQDPDRKYAMARVSALNCVTGVPAPERTIRFESQPLSQAQAGDFEPNVSEMWGRTVRDRLGKLSLDRAGAPETPGTPGAAGARGGAVVSGLARITRIDGATVFFTPGGYPLFPSQVVQVFANKDGVARPLVELVITDVTRREIEATFNSRAPGFVMPQIGDFIQPAGLPAVASPSPAAR
jgi:hypothetical protein